MAINTIALASKMTGELDKAVVQKSTTGFLADNVMKSKFVGAKTVLIPDVEFSGLGDYDRDTGFVRGSITVANTSYTMGQDRARSFQLDREDNDESGVSNLAGQVMGEFIRTEVVPEMDAYCLSKLGGYAATQNQTVAPDSGKTLADSVYSLFIKAVDKAQEAVGFDEELVCFVNNAVWTAMQTTTEISRSLVVSNFKQGEIDLKVKSLNGIALRPVVSSRMKTAFTFYDGVTDTSSESGGVDQTAGGFVPAAAAKNIGILVLPRRAASLVKKTETIRVFSPEKNLTADAYKFDYRIYYDVFIRNSLKTGIIAYVY